MAIESEQPKGREILLPDVKIFLAEARAKTYASNIKPQKTPMIPGSKELRFKGSGWVYHDRYFDASRRPGNFAGVELITADDFWGSKHLMVYSYGGGLTQEGLELGEEEVYGSLQKFLKEEAARARMGESFNVTNGEWEYENEGEVTDWGWRDHEVLRKNGVLVHEVNAQGICLIKGF